MSKIIEALQEAVYTMIWIYYDPSTDRLYTASLAEAHQFPHWARVCEL